MTMAPARENTGSVEISRSLLTTRSRDPLTRASYAEEAAVAALRDEEKGRTAVFALLAAGVCCFGVIASPLMGGAIWLAATVAQAVLMVVCGWVVWRVQRHRFDLLTVRVLDATVTITTLVVVAYYGVFSPAPTLMLVTMFFFASSSDHRFVNGLVFFSIAAYSFVAASVLFEALADPGLVTVRSDTTVAALFVLFCVPTICASAFWGVRAGRRVAARAVERLQEAIVDQERQRFRIDELHRAFDLQAGVGRLGRYSGEHAGRFRLEEVIGRGAMGEVYLAVDEVTSERAAVKVLLLDAGENAQAHRRFLRERDILAQLRHPNIVELRETGSVLGAPFLAMEFLEGQDLAALLREVELPNHAEIRGLIEQVGSGIDAAHGAGVIHRDIKPQNLFRVARDEALTWKVLDFGISQLGGPSATMTQQVIVGTPGYMSPEQARGEPTDVRSDVFSFGAVIYRVATGQPPFGGMAFRHGLAPLAYRSPVRPSEANPSVPAGLDDVLAIALARKVEHRFATASELVDAAIAALDGHISRERRGRARRILTVDPWRRLEPQPRGTELRKEITLTVR